MIFVYIFFLTFFFLKLFINKKKNFYILFPLLLINYIVLISYVIVNEITGNGFTRSFWYHLNFNLSSGALEPYFVSLLFKFIFILIIVLSALKLAIKKIKIKKQNLFYICIILLFINPSFFSLIPSYLSWKNLKLNSLEKIDLDKHFYNINLNELKKSFDKRDIIFISAESFERTFYSKKMLKSKDLMNRNDIFDFNNVNQIENYTDWTIAGLVAANCGKPIVYSNDSQNVDHYNSFANKSSCLSDILHYLNYDQYLIQGSSLKFGGNGNFYRLHKISNQFGKEEIIDNSNSISFEYSHWGIHDNHVLDFATDKIKFLEIKKQPYSIWINTLDNHAPNGLLSDNCNKLFPNIKSQMIKIANCTDKILNDFIENIFKADKDKNNLVIVHSDHLLMNSPFQKKNFDDNKSRKNLFLIIDPYQVKEKKIFNSTGNLFDIPATVIDYLSGINRLGFGKSLINSKFISNDNDFTINHEFNDYQIIKSFENQFKVGKNFFNIEFEIKNKNHSIIFKNDVELSLPILILPNEIIISSEDVDGNPQLSLIQLILKNEKKILSSKNFEIISKCSEINHLFEININCKYGILNIKKGDNNYVLSFLKANENNKYIVDNHEYEFSAQKNKDFFNEILKSDSYYQSSESFKYFSKKVKLFLNELSPEILIFTQNVFRQIKYLNIKYNIIGLENLFKTKKIIPNKDNFIAHAGGKIDELIYTNSIEAINLNYKKGIRYFEIDLALTSDNNIVAVHDWKSWQKMTGFDGIIPPQLNTFLNQKIYKKYNPIDIEILNDWIQDHKDSIIITDKIDNLEILKKFLKDEENYLHEVFNTKELDYAINNNISNILISEKIIVKNNFDVNFLKKLASNNIYGLSVSRHSIYKFPDFYEKAKSMGLKIFVYRLNDGLPGGSEKEIVCNFENFITAVYADKIPDLNSPDMETYCY